MTVGNPMSDHIENIGENRWKECFPRNGQLDPLSHRFHTMLIHEPLILVNMLLQSSLLVFILLELVTIIRIERLGTIRSSTFYGAKDIFI